MNNVDFSFKTRPKRTKLTLSKLTQKTIRSLIITLSAMIVVLAIVNIVLTTSSSQKGYALEQKKLRNEHLKSENVSISTKLTNATISTELENNEIVDDMLQAEEKTYVEKEDNMIK